MGATQFSMVASLIIVGCLSLPTVVMANRVSLSKMQTNQGNGMQKMLDAMHKLMTGEEQFNQTFYSNLRECMNTFDSLLPLAQDAAWQGIIDYWNMNGTPNDPWGGFRTNYFEYNISATNLYGMLIFEPCDYASNIAYYHDVTEFCEKRSSSKPFSLAKEIQDSLGKAFSVLAMGSSFMHGSHTILGRQQDRLAIKAVAYLIHQGSLSSLSIKSSILHDLSDTPRPRTAVEIVDDFQNMYLTLPVDKWYDKTLSFDIPAYELTFAALFSTILTIGFEPDTVDIFVYILTNAFNLPDELKSFIFEKYLPEIRNATAHTHIDDVETAHFLGNTIAPVIKLIYAFLWQERELTKSKLFLDPVVNYIGWELLPEINYIANQFLTYEHFDPQFQEGVDVYPGDFWCNPVIPHAKWHLESGIGLLDLTYLADEINSILSNA